ncbi:MAG: hypothetical protein HC898_08580 [Phycisphaerales bacterium]|nr:hypothetical protein [Phycisphaerales bacterium]
MNILKVPLPEQAGEDSVSFLPLLKGETPESFREGIIHHSYNGIFAIRCGEWKLLACRGSGGWSLSEDAAAANPIVQLYNLADDPMEKNNLYDSHRTKADEMMKLLNHYCQSDRSVSISAVQR